MVGVLKKDHVKFSGTRVLVQTPAGAPARVATATATRAAGPQARIVEQNGPGVVIEVVCECGQKIYLNCDCA
jgi:hypothetical protein